MENSNINAQSSTHQNSFAGVVLRQSKSKCESKDIVFIEKVS